jgi:hypothetical protein
MTAMRLRPASLTGAPVMECPDCGAVCAYWDADDMTPNPDTGALELHCADWRYHYGACVHCRREIHLVDGAWIDPAATGDDSVWRESCDAHDTFTAEHEPGAAWRGCLQCGAPDHLTGECAT